MNCSCCLITWTYPAVCNQSDQPDHRRQPTILDDQPCNFVQDRSTRSTFSRFTTLISTEFITGDQVKLATSNSMTSRIYAWNNFVGPDELNLLECGQSTQSCLISNHYFSQSPTHHSKRSKSNGPQGAACSRGDCPNSPPLEKIRIAKSS